MIEGRREAEAGPNCVGVQLLLPRPQPANNSTVKHSNRTSSHVSLMLTEGHHWAEGVQLAGSGTEVHRQPVPALAAAKGKGHGQLAGRPVTLQPQPPAARERREHSTGSIVRPVSL